MTVATESDAGTIAAIDFGALRSGTTSERRSELARLDGICRDTGFFYLVNHGIDPALLAAVMQTAESFFALPDDARHAPDLRASPVSPRGYVPIGTRQVPGTTGPLHQEALKFELPLRDDDPEILAGDRLRHKNKWPADLPGMKQTVLAYFEALRALSDTLLDAIAEALGISPETFVKAHQKPFSILSFIHYPQQPEALGEGVYGVHPHTDAASFSVLIQDTVGGLQVQARDGSWLDVPHKEGTLVVNIGDFLELWTGGAYRSSPHRVINRQPRSRISIPFFAMPGYDTVVAPLPEFTSDDRAPVHIGSFFARVWSSHWK